MHPQAELLPDGSQRSPHPLGNRDTLDRKPPVTSRLLALVREAEKVKRLRATFAAVPPTFFRKAAELDEPRFGVVELQAELGEPRPQFGETRFRFVAVFEADHEIVRVADDHHVAPAAVLPPPLDPQ
jgi:hypothetical protein